MTTDDEQFSKKRRELGQTLLAVTRNPGETARRLRRQRGASVEQIAQALEVDATAVRRFEKSGIISSLECASPTRSVPMNRRLGSRLVILH